MDGGIGEAVEEEVHLAELHHEVGDVVAGEVVVQGLTLIEAEAVASDAGAGRGVGREDVLEGADEEAARAAGGIKDALPRLRIEAGDDEINDVTRCAELAVVTLSAHA